VTARDDRAQRRALFLAVVAASAATLTVIGLVLRRRRPAPARRDDGDDAPPVARGQAGAQPPLAPNEAAPQHGKVCPVCGLRYGPDALYCGQEGAALVVLNER
jgi:hypothetical protein